jgi:hypothetical protein
MPTLAEQCLFISTIFNSITGAVNPPILCKLSVASIVYITQQYQYRGYNFLLNFFTFLLEKHWIIGVEEISDDRISSFISGEAIILKRSEVKCAMNLFLWKMEFD